MQPEVILKGFEAHGAVALVSLGLWAGLVLLGLRLITAGAQVALAQIAARKELRLAKLKAAP